MDASSNPLKEKGLDFAIKIVELYKCLCARQEYVMSKQLLRSGTSIGANVSEAQRGQSVPDFAAKMYVALKEAEETMYWLILLERTGYLEQEEAKSIKMDCEELIRILVATTKRTNYRTFE